MATDSSKGCSIVLVVISVNAILSIILLAGMVYCITQITQHQREIANYRHLSNEFRQQDAINVGTDALRSKDNERNKIRAHSFASKVSNACIHCSLKVTLLKDNFLY